MEPAARALNTHTSDRLRGAEPIAQNEQGTRRNMRESEGGDKFGSEAWREGFSLEGLVRIRS